MWVEVWMWNFGFECCFLCIRCIKWTFTITYQKHLFFLEQLKCIRVVFFKHSYLLSVIEVLLPFCMFWKWCLQWLLLDRCLSVDLAEFRGTEHRSPGFCTLVCYSTSASGPLGIQCVFLMVGKTEICFDFAFLKTYIGLQSKPQCFYSFVIAFLITDVKPLDL